jgi:ParB family chromosome partitioning protein
MSKDKDLLSRFGSNLAESMGAGRSRAGEGGAAAAKADPGPASRLDGTTRLRSGAEIAVERITPDPNQPRTEFDDEAIDRLAASLKSHGQLQPIAVRWGEAEGRYVIVTGERRWRASVRAGKPTVTAVVLEGAASASQILEMQLIENALREDLKPVEQARAFRALMDRNGWPALRLAETLHLNVATVTRALALLDLPAPVQDRVEAGTIAPSVAYEISKVEHPDDQHALAERVVNEGLSRAETIRAVRKAARPSSRTTRGKSGSGGRKVTSRVIRTSAARVTVDLRKAADTGAVLRALREAVRALEDELGGHGQEAA